MMKKILSVMLAVLMTVLPVITLAASPVDTITETFKTDGSLKLTAAVDIDKIPFVSEEIATLIKDTIEAASFSIAFNDKNQVSLDLNLEDSAFTLLYFEKGDVPVLASPTFLGKQLIRATEDDLLTLYAVSLIKTYAEYGYTMDLETAKSYLQQSGSSMPVSAITEEGEPFQFTKTEAAVQENAVVAYDYSPVATKNFDTPAMRATLNLTHDQLSAIGQAILQDMLANEAFCSSLTNYEMTEQDAVTAMQNKLDLVENVLIDCYMDENEKPVYILITVTPAETVAEAPINVEYARQTSAAGVGIGIEIYQEDNQDEYIQLLTLIGDKANYVSLLFSENGQDELNATLVSEYDYDVNPAVFSGSLTVNKYGAEALAVSLSGACESDAAGLLKVADMSVDVSAYGRQVGRLLLTAERGQVYQLVGNEKQVKPADMTEDDITDWISRQTANISIGVLSMAQKLPASVLTYLMKMIFSAK